MVGYPHTLAARSLLMTLMLCAPSALVAPASAQSTNLHGIVATTNVHSVVQNWPNVPVSTLQDLHAHDPLGNDGYAKGTLSIPTGTIKLSPHGCSGGGPGFGGQAVGGASASVILDYKIISPTLPLGTPDTLIFAWSLASRVTAVGYDMVGANTNASSSASVHIALAPNYNVESNRSGTLLRSISTSGVQKIISGNLSVASDTAHFPFPMQVGQIIRVTIDCDVSTNSSSESGVTDGDAQLSAVWGLTSKTPGASVVLLSDPSQPAPPAEKAIPDSAIAGLDVRPTYLLPCFKFAAQPESVATCGPSSASFSAAAQGAGPFTYQWRKNGVPIDLQTNPTAQSATLSISSVSSGDAGSYDVVVYNACGRIVSNHAGLSVCTLSAPETPPSSTRLARARPAPFRASTALAFDLARSGMASIEVYDLRGARVRVLTSGWHVAGHDEVQWRGDDESGRPVPGGLYMVRLRAGGTIDTQRVVKLN